MVQCFGFDGVVRDQYGYDLYDIKTREPQLAEAGDRAVGHLEVVAPSTKLLDGNPISSQRSIELEDRRPAKLLFDGHTADTPLAPVNPLLSYPWPSHTVLGQVAALLSWSKGN